MACNIVNPTAPNGQPSDLWRELNTHYDAATSSAIYTEAESILLSSQKRYDAANDIRQNGELTYAAVMRLVTPLLTGRAQDGLDATIPGVLQTIQDRLEALYEGMRREHSKRQLLNSNRTIQRFGGGLPEDNAHLRNEANQLSNTNTHIAYVELMRFVHDRLTTINQLTDKNNGLDIANADYYRIVSSLRDELQLYTQPLGLGNLAKHNSGLEQAVGVLNQQIAATLGQTNDWLQEAFLSMQNSATSNKDLKDNRDALLREQQYGEDINTASRLFQATGDSANSLVAMAGKLFRTSEAVWKRNTEKFKHTFAAVYQGLLDANGGVMKGAFDYMLGFENGKPNGRYVVKESTAYKLAREAIEATLLDPNDPTGQRKLQYNTVKFSNVQGAADLAAIKAHNINIATLRETRRDWHKPEHIEFDHNDMPYVRQGDNHRYTQEFLDERAKYQRLVKTGPDRAEWQPLYNVADPATPPSFARGYDAFISRYYEAETDTELPQKTWDPNLGKKVYTGEVLRAPVRYVKRDFVTVQPKWESQGYKSIMADNSRLGQARRSFYEFFMKSIDDEVLRKLGPAARMNFYGEVPRIRKGRSDSAAEAIKNGAKNFASILRPTIDWNTYTRSRAVDANGNFIDGIPIYMVGGLKSEAAVAQARADFEAADTAWRAAPRDAALKLARQEAKEKLRATENAIEADELETDLYKSLLTFYEMAQEHHELKKQEPVFRQVKTLIEGMKFLNADNMGEAITGVGANANQKTYGTKGQASNLWKQFNDFMDLNIYNNERADTLAERIGDGFLRWSGSLMQSFNIGSQINELVSGNINQFLQMRFDNKFGGSGFLKEGAYLAAQAEVIGGTMAKTGEELMRLFRDPSMLEKPHGKVAAVMEQLFIHQNTSPAQALKTGNNFADAGYKLLNISEFYTQATLAVARLRSVDVEMKDSQGNPTGETKSLWEILEYDQQSGQLHWPQDSISEEELITHVVQIRAMVSSIHGNYNSRDRVAIQRHMLGRLAYQFKKWTYQLGRNRWGEQYFDEGLQEYREGRYRTVARFLQNVWATKLKIADRWDELPVQEKINIAKTGADLTMFVSLLGMYCLLGAAAGDDDDDDALTHRLVNFMARQADRSAGEVSAGWNVFEWARMLKNPLPILRQFENAEAILHDFTGIGAWAVTGDDAHILTQRGLHRGQYKLTNSLIKLIPGGLLRGQWEQSATSPKYFVTQ